MTYRKQLDILYAVVEYTAARFKVEAKDILKPGKSPEATVARNFTIAYAYSQGVRNNILKESFGLTASRVTAVCKHTMTNMVLENTNLFDNLEL